MRYIESEKDREERLARLRANSRRYYEAHKEELADKRKTARRAKLDAMSEEEREALREKNRIYQAQYRKAHPDKVAIWTARTWQKKAGYNETKPCAEWIKHDKGFFRLRVGMDYTPWFTFLLDPDTIIGICNLENAEVEWKADYECSMCGSRAWEEETNYCPNCGAEMNA